jgi:hypothetical protein
MRSGKRAAEEILTERTETVTGRTVGSTRA